MKPPPLLIGAALLFWGWQTGFLIAGAVMAVVLESTRLLKTRWEFSDGDLTRIWTFCSLLFLAAIVYAFAVNDGVNNFSGLFQEPGINAQRRVGDTSSRTAVAAIRWLPMVLFLFVTAQSFNTRETLPLATISLIFRRRLKQGVDRRESRPAMSTGNVLSAYFAVCLCAACASLTHEPTFYAGFGGLIVWALWPYRSRRYGVHSWAVTLAVALVLGYFGRSGMIQLRNLASNYNPGWLSQFSRRGFGPERTRTELGSVGEIKLSGRIVIRLSTPEGEAPPNLLREASYREYQYLSWLAGGTSNLFQYLAADSDGTSWDLVPRKTNTAAVTIACAVPGRRALLPLPAGSGRLEHLQDFVILSRNENGAVLAEQAGLVIFDALYAPGATLDSPANTSTDLKVPEREKPALQRIVTELELAGDTREDKLQALRRFFGRNFSYSLWQRASLDDHDYDTPLARFLLETRSGHCEYFATATVLLLRMLDVPARYAVGYAVHEGSGRQYVVRQRDAHAWCLVWNDNTKTWEDFDTTPASWIDVEGSRASMFQWLSDAWSRIKFEIAKVRWGQTNLRRYLLLSLIPVLLFLLYRIVFRRRKRRGNQASSADVEQQRRPGLDSEFYLVGRKLEQLGFERRQGETLTRWLERITATEEAGRVRAMLKALLQQHYRLRFDPLGLSEESRVALRQQARSCVTDLECLRSGSEKS